MLGRLFREEQIFRIDHYLARETLQNILTFRFSNTIFEPVWNNNYIEKVEIRLLETIGVELRGAFYEDIGALRDVGQNHLLQMLAIIAMDHPGPIRVDSIRRERARIISSLIPPAVNAIKDSVVRGQYIGFTGEKDVHADSTTETYFRIKAYLDNDRWRGVPFYLESGKALKEKKTEIAVYFKENEPCFCPSSHKERSHQNIFTFKIQPDEGISIRFWARQPGLGEDIERRDFAFNYGEGSTLRTDAYERVLYDCIQGDQTLFVSTDEVTAAWEYITSILNNWLQTELHKYEKGSGGPEVSLE
jgi:glucose-6-phosphate 1-dehydrogenase